jgi:hypothetical protein
MSTEGTNERVTPHYAQYHWNPNSFYDWFLYLETNANCYVLAQRCLFKTLCGRFFTQYLCVLVLCELNWGARMNSGAPARCAMGPVTGLQPARNVRVLT